MRPAEAEPRNHYGWGEGCSGWRLLEHEQLQVRREAMPPGTAEEPHLHRRAHQFFYVLGGTMTIRTPHGLARLEPGQGLHVPAGVAHRVSNEAAGELVFLLASSPATEGDRFPAAVHEPASPSG